MKKPTVPPPLISYGTNEFKILRYLKNHQEDPFVLRAYSADHGIARTTIYDTLKRLKKRGFVDEYKRITKNGIYAINQVSIGNEGVVNTAGCVRRGGRAGTLSTHSFRYKCEIKELPKNITVQLNKLNPERVEPNKLINFTEYYAYFKDATIVVKLNTLYIHIEELLSEDITEAHYLAFETALSYAKNLSNVNIKIGKMYVENSHYARIESLLAKYLSKIDKNYKITLNDGHTFFIDRSDKLEDETKSPKYRDRLDTFLKDLNNSESTMSTVDRTERDMDKVYKIFTKQADLAGKFLKLELAKNNSNLKQRNDKLSANDNYFG